MGATSSSSSRTRLLAAGGAGGRSRLSIDRLGAGMVGAALVDCGERSKPCWRADIWIGLIAGIL